MYEAQTLNEVWPDSAPFGDYYWLDEDVLRNDRRSVNHWNR